jgi:hypothetical protein
MDEERTALITTLHETLVKESQNNNELATSILSVIKDEKSERAGIEGLKERVTQAEKTGDPLAIAFLTLLTQQGQAAEQSAASLPNANRIQQVSLDDYEAVKSMWVENYHNLDVPQAINGVNVSRKEWLQGDINEISQTISLLTSQDPVKIEEGMKQVSNILPFLLIGGFSQDEIVSYLKAKLEAAKTVKGEIDKSADEEDTMISATTHKTEAPKTMSQHATSSIPQAQVPTSHVTLPSEAEDVSPLVSTQMNSATNGTSQILKLSNLTLPTMHDIVEYEKSLLSNTHNVQTTKIVNVLKNVSHPENIHEESERNQILQLREFLTAESQNNNPVATSFMTASQVLADKNVQVVLPEKNAVQPVSIDDYESVRKMWIENYKELSVPQDPEHPENSREIWLEKEIQQITVTLSLLTSGDPQKIHEGLQHVSEILPFLLVGGFSKDEIISYLKAKLEAAKFVLAELKNREKEKVPTNGHRPESDHAVKAQGVHEPTQVGTGE